MKISFVILVVFMFHLARGQEQKTCNQIVISDSLFYEPIDQFSFDILEGNIVRNVRMEDIQDINDIITIDNDCLEFRISYGCGCGTKEKERILVTNAVNQREHFNNNFYYIKLYYRSYDSCEALCREKLSFDISALKNPGHVTYLKFVGFDQFIVYH